MASLAPVVAAILVFTCIQSLPPSSATKEDTCHLVKVTYLLPSTVCTPYTGGSNRTLRVVHGQGPCSPISAAEKLTAGQILHRDRVRTAALHSRVATSRRRAESESSLAQSTLPASFGVSFGAALYVVSVGLGSPKKEMTLAFDTASDLTWIQCEPCVGYCHSQKEPIFNPSASATYSNISCGSAECSNLQTSTGQAGTCSASNCVYGIQYGDQSYSIGFFAREKLTLPDDDSLPGFMFGCGEKNRGNFGELAGILGLGRDKVSLVSQAAGKFGEVFSYCLPPKTSADGYLSLGSQYSPGVKFTPLLTDDPPSFYFLDMIGLKVGGRKLPIKQSVFSDPGTIIDSGTVITRLPPAAYASLRAAFRKQMSKYPSAAALSILDTCYDLSSYSSVSVPKIVLLFNGGVEVEVVITGILFGSSASQICLAFASNAAAGDVGILGNTQQRGYEVVYDIGSRRVGFGMGAC